jgi:hypothetical protein
MKNLWEEPVQSVPVDEVLLRSAEQNASPWKAHSAEQNEPMRWKAYSLGYIVPPAPPTRLERVRSWLGWKLWRLAARLEPDVAD